jgi:hypothetical protein
LKKPKTVFTAERSWVPFFSVYFEFDRSKEELAGLKNPLVIEERSSHLKNLPSK